VGAPGGESSPPAERASDRGVMSVGDGNTVDAALIRELLAELQGLRQEVAELRLELRNARQPAVAASPTPPALPASATATTWMQRRNAERLAAEVQRRKALLPDAAVDGESDTELDLMIDRLHDLALDHGG
jgi:hypothetical protein